MKFIVDVTIPREPFNMSVGDGSAGRRLGETLGAIRPEVIDAAGLEGYGTT